MTLESYEAVMGVKSRLYYSSVNKMLVKQYNELASRNAGQYCSRENENQIAHSTSSLVDIIRVFSLRKTRNIQRRGIRGVSPRFKDQKLEFYPYLTG